VKRAGCAIVMVAFVFTAKAMMNAQSLSPSDVQQIAERAYVYAYPMVLLQETMRILPPNHLAHVSAFPDASFRLIVRPNADTLYSNAWIDVSKEPMLLHVPDSGGRFYLLQFMDAWTETFADPGKRTTGTGEAWFALVGPGWHGELPPHVTRLDASTNQIWLLGRTQTNGASDYDNVHAFQRGMLLVPLSEFPGKNEPSHPPVSRPSETGTTVPEQIQGYGCRAILHDIRKGTEGESSPQGRCAYGSAARAHRDRVGAGLRHFQAHAGTARGAE